MTLLIRTAYGAKRAFRPHRTMSEATRASPGILNSGACERYRLLMASPGAADPFDMSVKAAWIECVSVIARRRLPPVAGVAIDRAVCWAGLYEQSPDGHAILGAAVEVPTCITSTAPPVTARCMLPHAGCQLPNSSSTGVRHFIFLRSRRTAFARRCAPNVVCCDAGRDAMCRSPNRRAVKRESRSYGCSVAR